VCAPYRQEFIYQKMLTYKGVSSIQAQVSPAASTACCTWRPTILDSRAAGPPPIPDAPRALLPPQVWMLPAALGPAADPDLSLLATGCRKPTPVHSPPARHSAHSESSYGNPAFPRLSSLRATWALWAHLILLCFADAAFFFFFKQIEGLW